MSFPRAFQSVVKGTDGKSLGDAIIAGQQRRLPEGEFDVTVVGIDRNHLADNKLTIKYATADGRVCHDQLYLTQENRETGAPELNYKFQNTLGMLIPSTEAYDAFLAECNAGNEEVIDLLLGLLGRLVMAYAKKGYGEPVANDNGTFYVANLKDGTKYVASSIADAEKSAKEAGLKKAFINPVRYVATHGSANVEKFTENLKAQRVTPKSAFAQRPMGTPGRGGI